MKKLNAWISACRLRTLPLSISGAIVGSGIAYSRGFFDSSVFALTIATTLSLTNFIQPSQRLWRRC